MVFWTPHGCGPEARFWAHRHLCRSPGVYAWYFDQVPPGISATRCHRLGDRTLLYVGISPKEPPKNGAPESRQTLRSRLRTHFSGNAAGSTLRLTWVASCQHPSVSRLDALAAADDTLLRIQVNANLMSGWRGTL